MHECLYDPWLAGSLADLVEDVERIGAIARLAPSHGRWSHPDAASYALYEESRMEYAGARENDVARPWLGRPVHASVISFDSPKWFRAVGVATARAVVLTRPCIFHP